MEIKRERCLHQSELPIRRGLYVIFFIQLVISRLLKICYYVIMENGGFQPASSCKLMFHDHSNIHSEYSCLITESTSVSSFVLMGWEVDIFSSMSCLIFFSWIAQVISFLLKDVADLRRSLKPSKMPEGRNTVLWRSFLEACWLLMLNWWNKYE